MSDTKITAAHARAELARRALAKTDPAYQNRGPAWQLSGAQLQALTASKPARKQAPTQAKPAPKPVNERAKVAQAAFEQAAASAKDGERIKAGIKARKAALVAYDAKVAA